MKKLLWAIILCTSFRAQGSCLENRAAISMGAASIKLVVAQIDFCKIEISKFLFEKEIVFDLFGPVIKNNNTISRSLQINTIKKLKTLVELAKEYKPIGIILLPSKFFKKSSNFMAFFKKIKEDLNVKIFLPDLKTEAILGFLGVKIKYPNISDKLLVWDVGVNGSNWTLLDENLDFRVHFEKMDPIIFKNMVIEGILKKDYKKVQTPNPLGSENAKSALELIKLYTAYNLPPKIKKSAKEFKVVGIGRFHNTSIMGQIGAKGASYNLPQLERALRKRADLKDQDIGGPFPDYQITNLILAMGFLSTMELEQVFTTNTNEAHGALMYPKFWKTPSK